MRKTSDIVAPLCTVPLHVSRKRKDLPSFVKNYYNKRNRLLKVEKSLRNRHHITEIKALDKKIAKFHSEKKIRAVRSLVDEPNGNIWNAVRAAKDQNHEKIPSNLTLNGVSIGTSSIASSFARHFADKIKLNVAKAQIDVNGVYNGNVK